MTLNVIWMIYDYELISPGGSQDKKYLEIDSSIYTVHVCYIVISEFSANTQLFTKIN